MRDPASRPAPSDQYKSKPHYDFQTACNAAWKRAGKARLVVYMWKENEAWIDSTFTPSEHSGKEEKIPYLIFDPMNGIDLGV